MSNIWLLIRQLKSLLRLGSDGRVEIDSQTADPLIDRAEELGFKGFVLARLQSYARTLQRG